MILVNENFLNLKPNYLFSEIAKRTEEFKKNNPNADLIKLGIGDVTRPFGKSLIEAMHKAVDEMSVAETFKGYGPEVGYKFLREKIADFDYQKKGIKITENEIFVSDGIGPDIGNFGDLLSVDNSVGIADPVYPEYLDVSIMAGRDKIVFIPFSAKNNFNPELPKEKIDLIYLCMPNNPTGTVLNKTQLKKWVDFAIEQKALILYDAAYECFIEDDNIPHSIYEIEGAKKVAIEFKSYSKMAGFTGLRCAYTVVPFEAVAYTREKQEIALNALWERRQSTKYNGASYISQKAAESIYTKEGQKEISENLKYYKRNAQIISEGLKKSGYEIFGGKNSPYIWIKLPSNYTSWSFFDYLITSKWVVGTPGVGFGPEGEGYFRLSSFGSYENTLKAVDRLTNPNWRP